MHSYMEPAFRNALSKCIRERLHASTKRSKDAFRRSPAARSLHSLDEAAVLPLHLNHPGDHRLGACAPGGVRCGLRLDVLADLDVELLDFLYLGTGVALLISL